MYDILIVDDEKIFNEGLKKELELSGYFKVTTALNGKDALKLVNLIDFKSIFIDIQMPQMNGLQFLEELNKIRNDSIKIVISGYDEFSYAKTAMKYDVVEYYLKPITPKDVSEITKKLKKLIEQKIKKTEEIKLLKKQVLQVKPIIKDKLFDDLLNNRLSKSSFEKRKKCLNVKLNYNYFQVAFLRFNNRNNNILTKKTLPKLNSGYIKLITKLIANMQYCELFRYNTGLFVLIFNFPDIDEYENYAGYLMERIFQNIEPSERDRLKGGIGNVYDGFTGLNRSFKEAAIALRYNSLLLENYTLKISDIEIKPDYSTNLIDEDDFLIKIKTGQINDLLNDLEKIFNKIVEMKDILSLKSLNFIIFKIITLGQEGLRNIKYFSKNNDLTESGEEFLELFSLSSMEKIKTWLENYLKNICEQINSMKINEKKRVIEKAKIFIEENYSNEIDVQSIAKNTFLSKNYLGQLFKIETKMTIKEYINKIRIKKAKEILAKTEMKINEVAYRVGFKDPHYFSLIFKKISGISPSEFKELY